MSALGAWAHLERCAPGHRQGVEALLRWHSQAGPATHRRERMRDAPDAEVEQLMARVRAALRRPVTDMSPAQALQPLPASALSWRPPRQRDAVDDAVDGPGLLGSLTLWSALGDEVEWADLACSVHRGGRWLLLQPELGPGRVDRAGDWRTPLLIDADANETLAGLGLSTRELAIALTSSARWVARRAGLGAFVDLAVDCGWPEAGQR